jgi:two-component system OmpR family response regulator
MDFGGDLSVLDPSMVFQIFGLSRLTGLLRFITPGNVVSCYFSEGELLYATMDTRKKKIGKVLIEKEYITEKQLNEALIEFLTKESNKRVGNILIDKGYLDKKSLESAIQEQMKEVVYQVLQLKEGQFIFFSGVEPKDEDIFLDVKLDHLILEGLKRLDELQDS